MSGEWVCPSCKCESCESPGEYECALQAVDRLTAENATLLARAEEAERERDALKAACAFTRDWLLANKHQRGWYIAKSVLLLLAGAKEVP